MNAKENEKRVQQRLLSLCDQNENVEPIGVEIISLEHDTNENICEGGVCSISMAFARRMKSMRNAKAA